MSHVIYWDKTGAAIWEESFLGDMAPFNDPVNHLLKLPFHSSLDNYGLAQVTPVTVSHAAIAASGTFTFTSKAYAFSLYFQRFVTDIHLCDHSLGVVPLVRVVDSNKFALPASFPIQQNGTHGHREVSIYATETDIRMKEIAIPGDQALSAFSKDYTVYVFETPTADPALPMGELQPDNINFGQGKFLLSQPRLRRTVTGETADLEIPIGRMTDMANGVVRYVQANGTIVDINSSTITYPNSFAGSTAIPAVVV